MPVRFHESVEEDDVVFCQVQPRGHFYAHLVKEKIPCEGEEGAFDYCISDIYGRVNGWCKLEHIYGKLFQVLRQDGWISRF